MAKKRGGKSRGEEVEEDDWSTVSTMSRTEQEMECFEDQADRFQAALDDTFESRGSTREKAWEALTNMMRSEVRVDDCMGSSATITGRALNSMRKGGANEAALAATAIGLLTVTLGESDERAFNEVAPELERACKHGKGAAKLAAIEALAVVCFVAAEDEHTTRDVMSKMHKLWTKETGKAKAAALRAWSLLFTSLNNMLDGDTMEGLLSDLSGMLHEGDVEVRAAAGEAIALMYHASGLGSLMEGDEEEEEGMDNDGGDEDGASTASTSQSGLDEVVGRMKDLATNRGREALRKSRRERAAMRSAFRGLAAMLQGGSVAATKIKLRHGDTLIINTLQGTVILNALRHLLAGGFQAHLQGNQLLHAVFDFEPQEERAPRLTALEKRHFRSPSSAQSKARTQDRKAARATKGDW